MRFLAALPVTSAGARALAFVAAAILLTVTGAAIACGGGKATPTAAPAPTPTARIVPPAFPLIFSGRFTVGSQPGPAGVKIFARIGTARSPVAETGAGTFNNLVLGPSDPANQSGKVEFFLGDPDGNTVKATQTYQFQVMPQPTIVQLDLSFAALP